MSQMLFRNWKFAALWAIGISASIAAFFADGGGHEQLEASAQQIREKRSNPHRENASLAEPAEEPSVAAAAPASEEEPEEPAFGEPSFDPGVDGEAQPGPVAPPAPKPAAGEEEL